MSTTKSDNPEWKGSDPTEWVSDGVTYRNGKGEAIRIRMMPSDAPTSPADCPVALTGAPLNQASYTKAVEALTAYVTKDMVRSPWHAPMQYIPLVPQSLGSAWNWSDAWASTPVAATPRPLTSTEQRLLAEYRRMGEFLMLFITAGPTEPLAAMPYIRKAAYAWTEMDLDRTDFNHRTTDPDRVTQARGHVLNALSAMLRLAWCTYPQYPDTYCITQAVLLQTAYKLIDTTESTAYLAGLIGYDLTRYDTDFRESLDNVQEVLSNTDRERTVPPVTNGDLFDDAERAVRMWVWLCEQDSVQVMLGDRLAEEFGIALPPLA